MKIFTRMAIAGAIVASALIAGCASTSSGSVYSSGQAGREQTVRMGVVESVRQVTIDGSNSGVGTIAGGAIGGVAGSNIGGGNSGSAVGTILGAIAGGVAGNAIEQAPPRSLGSRSRSSSTAANCAQSPRMPMRASGPASACVCSQLAA